MKNLFLLVALVGMTFSFAQEKGNGSKEGKREMIKQQKIAFITQEVGFTEKEAEKFWPKYNSMEESREEHRKKMKSIKKQMKEIDSKSDKEVKKLIEDIFQLEKEDVEMKEKFINELFGILPPKKVAKYMAAEHKFKKVLLKKLQDHKGRKGGPNRQN